jgi:putative protein kinase ArgK-like GTPase of G3E family
VISPGGAAASKGGEKISMADATQAMDRMSDLNVLLMIAGAGDELQGIKRGIMETADVVVLTKVDGEGRDRAQVAARDLQNAIHLLPLRHSGRHPEVMLVSALSGEGIPGLSRAPRVTAVQKNAIVLTSMLSRCCASGAVSGSSKAL